MARLHLAEPVDVRQVKADWLAALEAADTFARRRPPDEVGCLCWSIDERRFVDPDEPGAGRVVAHFGAPGGVLPRILEGGPA